MLAVMAAAALVMALLVVTAPGTAGSPAAGNAGDPAIPTSELDVGGELDLDEPATVTLITGDKVTMHPDGSITTEPGEGRAHITFETRSEADGTLVVPSDAADLLTRGALDPRLFNVTYLIREGYDDASRDDLPIILQGAPSSARGLAATSDVQPLSVAPGLTISAVTQDKFDDVSALWSRIAKDAGPTASLPGGVEKVWLDGMSHVTLDESVPQIGAQSAWEAGFTGEGVTVAVLDTGVDSAHPDLEGQVVADEVFAQNPAGLGVFTSDQVGFPMKRFAMGGSKPVPSSGSSDPLVHVGRACTETEGDELDADPAGKTALIVRGVCPFAEKYDAAVAAGATGVVIYNDAAGLVTGTVEGAEHEYEVWAAGITDAAGTALLDALADDAEVRLTLADNVTGDLYGHGTHVAATIAGTGAGSDGARRGVAPDAEIMNGKVCHDDGSCQDSWVIAGMVWAASKGADVVNMSLGGAPTDGTDLKAQVLNTLTDTSDTLFVTSAGNSGGQWTVGTPGSADAALTVGAVDKDGAMADFSSRGPRKGDNAVKPEITGPGVNIVAARAGGTILGAPVDDLYTALNGTSMAAPHVAGAAALLAQAKPDLAAGELKDVLVSTATDGGHSWLAQGAGLVNVARAVDQDVYADATVNVGSLDADSKAVTREITYSNDGRRSAVLRLEATITDQFGRDAATIPLSRRPIHVRPGGETTVPVRIDPDALDLRAGTYGVEVAATDRDLSLRTVIGFTIEREIAPLEDNWDEDWVETVAFDLSGQTNVKGAELSSDGEQIFVFAASDQTDVGELTVMAVDADSGDQLWRADTPVTYSSSRPRPGIAVAPDDSAVYVTQKVWDPENAHHDILTVAYNNVAPADPGDPALGDQLWQAKQDNTSPFLYSGHGPVNSIEPTPDGDTVLILVHQLDPGPGHGDECPPEGPAVSCLSSLLIIAYDVQTGEQSWVARYKKNTENSSGDLVISPSGELAYVTTVVAAEDGQQQGITMAYDLKGGTAGEVRWTAEHEPYSAVHVTSPQITISADGERVFVTSSVQTSESPPNFPMETLALDAATGERLWAMKLTGADHGFGPGHTTPDRDYKGGGIVISPDDDLVFVTGKHAEGEFTGAHALVTVAYDQHTGSQRWVQFHESSKIRPSSSDGSPRGTTAAVSPDGKYLYVVGTCCYVIDETGMSDQVTLAYDTATGDLVSTARLRYDEQAENEGQQVLVSPDGGAVYTVGRSLFGPRDEDIHDYVGIAAYTSPAVQEE